MRASHCVVRRTFLAAEILRRSSPDQFGFAEKRQRLVEACRGFIRMYRPHAAREDTVLFPALRTILAPAKVEAMGDRMEEDEHRVLGDEGFERYVDQVLAIEKQLGIADLSRFTPRT